MTDEEIIKIVADLNYHISDIDDCPEHSFSFICTGFYSAVMFNEFCLWNSEDSDRRHNEETNEDEPFDLCIKRLFNEYLEDINRFKFKRLKKFKTE